MVGADVGGRALAPDMLLARLAHQPPGHLPQMRRPGRHESDSGTAELWREAEALSLANGDVGAAYTGRLQKAQRQRFGRDRDRNSAGAFGERCGLAQRLYYSK